MFTFKICFTILSVLTKEMRLKYMYVTSCYVMVEEEHAPAPTELSSATPYTYTSSETENPQNFTVLKFSNTRGIHKY